MAKINFKNGAINETYELETVKPTPPFATIKQGNLDYFLKLTDKACGNNKIKLNGMFVYVETIGEDKFLYYSDKNNILHKVNANNGREIWSYNVGNIIKSIAIDNDNDILILTTDRVIKVNNNRQFISNFLAVGSKMIIDNNMYISKGNKVSKLDSNYKEVANYTVNGDITNLVNDDKGNVYIGTSNEITKVKNDFVASGESKNYEWKYKVEGNRELSSNNILPPFNESNWRNANFTEDGVFNSVKNISDNADNIEAKFFISVKENTKYNLSWKYNKGNTIRIQTDFYSDSKDFDHTFLSTNKSSYSGNSCTLIMPKNCRYLFFMFYKTDTEYEITDVKLQEIQGEGTYSLATKGDNLYIATKDDIEILDANGNMIDGLNYTNTNAIAVDKENMYLGQGNDLNEYIGNNKQWTSKNNSEITNIILER